MSATEESLSSIFSNPEAPKEAPAPTGEVTTEKAETVAAPPAEQEKPKGPERDEAGKFKKAEEAPPEKPQKSEVSALIAMRQRLQAAENRVRELESPKQARPSVFDDEDAAIKVRVAEETRSTREAILSLSRDLAISKHGDSYAEAEEAFFEAAEANPEMYEKLRASSNPGEYIYAHGTFHKKLTPHNGDIMRMLEHETGAMKGEIANRDTRIKALEAEVERLSKLSKDLEALPRSLNSRASGQPQAATEDDEEISTITRFGNKQR